MPHRLRYAALPSENVCTENLTPFVHMLPCKTKSGIAQLLNPYRLFDADWHGMSIDITSWDDGNLSLKLIVGAVFDPVRRSDPDLLKGEMIPCDWDMSRGKNERF
jgi:phosphatidylinositol glycan class T